MANSEGIHIKSPQVYLLRMLVFLILAGFLAAVLYPPIKRSFLANPGLNGMIVAVLVLGCAYAFRQVIRLFREVHWVNQFRIADPGLEVQSSPVLLAPMATLLGDRRGRFALNPMSMRSLMDSIANRLDEARDISRYMIGLLIFLGLLGTFWGLLETVSSVGQTIGALKVDNTGTLRVLEDLKAGLEGPLKGMGTAFSSSLFGLAGSLILGFLDLQASQAQNRFYNELEEWLSSITDIQLGEHNQADLTASLVHTMRSMQHTLERLDKTAGDDSTGDPIGELAAGVRELVQQMRAEQGAIRAWAEAQAKQQGAIKQTLDKLSAPPPKRKGASR